MFTDKEMKQKAEKFLFEIMQNSSLELILLDDYTIKKDYGNIYFYTSKKYFETKDDRFALVGNGPFLIENTTGNIVRFGSARSDEFYIQEYEAGRWPNNRQ